VTEIFGLCKRNAETTSRNAVVFVIVLVFILVAFYLWFIICLILIGIYCS
jgi:hypothetical protein